MVASETMMKGKYDMKKYVMIFGLMIGATVVHANENPSDKKSQVVEISVTEKGFEPPNLKVLSGVDTILKVTRKTDNTCATKILIPSKKIKTALPLNKSVDIAIGKLEKGKIKFSCGMNMMGGVIEVD